MSTITETLEVSTLSGSPQVSGTAAKGVSYRVLGEASLSRLQAASTVDLIFAWARSSDPLERADIQLELRKRK